MKNMLILAMLANLTSLSWGGELEAYRHNSELNVASLDALRQVELMDKNLNRRVVLAGYVSTNDPSAVAPVRTVEWVTIEGGKFMMGTDDRDFPDAKPVREVAIKTFEMSKTAVTVEQYMECVAKDKCRKPARSAISAHALARGSGCNWDTERSRRLNHPMNCVTWEGAVDYAKFVDARLPSESEWEYAATSGGKNQKYPWGNALPTDELAVINTIRTEAVCSKPAGNTAQGLCDMAGNVWQWVQDTYRTRGSNQYDRAPVDGSAVEDPAADFYQYRLMRGGSYSDGIAGTRVENRTFLERYLAEVNIGFRLAR